MDIARSASFHTDEILSYCKSALGTLWHAIEYKIRYTVIMKLNRTSCKLFIRVDLFELYVVVVVSILNSIPVCMSRQSDEIQ